MADEQVERESRRCASACAPARPRSARPRQGDFVVIDYVGSLPEARRGASACEPFEGGEGRDQLIELGGGNLIPASRRAARRRGGRDAHRRADLPGRLRRRAARRARGVASRSPSRRSSSRSCRSSTRTSRSTPASTTWSELREDIREPPARGRGGAHRGGVPPGRARRGRGRRAASRCTPELVKRARQGDVGAHAALALPPRHLARGLPADHRARGGGDLAEMEPEAELALKREAVSRRSCRRGYQPVRGGAARGARPRPPSARASSRRRCSATCARGRLEDVREDLAAREAIDLARRARPSRSRPPRRRRARRCGPPPRRRRPPEGRGGRRRGRPAVDTDRSDIGQ